MQGGPNSSTAVTFLDAPYEDSRIARMQEVGRSMFVCLRRESIAQVDSGGNYIVFKKHDVQSRVHLRSSEGRQVRCKLWSEVHQYDVSRAQ